MQKIRIEKIDCCIESLAYVAPYHEILKFETAAILHGPLKINFDAFFQFIFDNADFNSQTLDGMNTFHTMGGVMCITPQSSVHPDQVIPRNLSQNPPVK